MYDPPPVLDQPFYVSASGLCQCHMTQSYIRRELNADPREQELLRQLTKQAVVEHQLEMVWLPPPHGPFGLKPPCSSATNTLMISVECSMLRFGSGC